MTEPFSLFTRARRVRSIWALIAIAMLFMGLQMPTASADSNPATTDMELDCVVERPVTTGYQSGVPAVSIGETVVIANKTTMAAGDVYQDAIGRADGSTYFAAYLRLFVPATELVAATAPKLTIGGSDQPLVPGTTPAPGQWVLDSQATAAGVEWKVYFPADPAPLLADIPGAGVVSYTVPAGGQQFVLSAEVAVPNVPSLVAGKVVPAAECFTSVSTGPSNRDTGVKYVKVAIAEPKLEIAKSADQAAVAPGGLINYTIDVSTPLDAGTDNEMQPGVAYDVNVIDTLPAGLTPVDASGASLADGASGPSGYVWNASARTLTWVLPTLSVGASQQFVFPVRVDASVANGSVIANAVSATATSFPGDNPGERVTSPVTATVPVGVGVGTPIIDKTAGVAGAGWGSNVPYTLTATFPADSPYYNATVSDVLPDGLLFTPATGYLTATCTSGCNGSESVPSTLTPVVSTSGTTRIGWYLGNLSSIPTDRVFTITYRARVEPTYDDGTEVSLGTTIRNVATVDANSSDHLGQALPSLARYPSFDVSDTDDATFEIAQPVLDIAKSENRGMQWDPQRTQPYVEWTITLTNTGNAAAYLVKVTDPSMASVGLATPTTISGGVTWASGVFTVPGSIAAGGSFTFTYRNVADAAFNGGYSTDVNFSNTATIKEYKSGGTGSATYPASGTTAPSASAIANAEYPAVTVDKRVVNNQAITPPQFGTGGDQITYEVEVNNTGTGSLFNPTIADVLPTGFTYVADSAQVVAATGVTFSDPAAPANAAITVAAPYAVPGTTQTQELVDGFRTGVNLNSSIAGGGSMTVRFRLASSSALGVWTNKATVSGTDGFGRTGRELTPGTTTTRTPYNATDSVDVELVRPVLDIQKTPDAVNNVQIAQLGSGQYTIKVTNTGTVAATNIVITDSLGASQSYNRQAVVTAGYLDAANPGGLWQVVPDPGAGLRPTLVETPTGAGTTSAPVWTISRLLAGASIIIKMPITHVNPVPNDLKLNNSASVDWASRSTTSSAPSDSGSLFVAPAANSPEVTKSVVRVDGTTMPDGVGGAPGTQLDYTIKWTIHEQSIATFDHTLIDTVPNGVTFGAVQSVSCASLVAAYCATPLTALTSATLANGTTRIGWFGGDRTAIGSPSAANDTVYTIVYRATIANTFGGDGTSPAGVTAGTQVQSGIAGGDPLVNTANPFWRTTDQFTAPGTLPDLAGNIGPSGTLPAFTARGLQAAASVKVYTPHIAISKSADKLAVNPDGTITYSLDITNNGTDTAYAAIVEDDLAGGRLVNPTQVSLVGDATATATLDNTGPTPKWRIDIPDLLPGQLMVFTYTAKAPDSADLTPVGGGDARDGDRLINEARAVSYHSTVGGVGVGDKTYAGEGPAYVVVNVFTPVLSTTIGPASGTSVILPSRGSSTRIRAYYDNTAYPNPNDRSSRVLTTTPAPDPIVSGVYSKPVETTAGTSFHNVIVVELAKGTEFVPNSAKVAGAMVGTTVPAAGTAITATFPNPTIVLNANGTSTLTWDLDALGLTKKLLGLADTYNQGLAIDFSQRSVQDAPVRACGTTVITGNDGSDNPDRGQNTGQPATYTARYGYCSSGALLRKFPDIGSSTDVGPKKVGESINWTLITTTSASSGTPGTLAYDAGFTIVAPIWEDTLPVGIVYTPTTASFTDGTTTVLASDPSITETITTLATGATRITWVGLPDQLPGTAWTATIPSTVSPTFVFDSTETARVMNRGRVYSNTTSMSNGPCPSGSSGLCDSGDVLVISNNVPAVAKSVNRSTTTFGDVLTYSLDVTIPANRAYKSFILDDYWPTSYNSNIQTLTNGTFTCTTGCSGVDNLVSAPMANWTGADSLGRHIGWLIGDGNFDGTVDGTINPAPAERKLKFTYTVVLKDAASAAPANYVGPNTARLFSYTGLASAGPITGVGSAGTTWLTQLTTANSMTEYGEASALINVVSPVVSINKTCVDTNNPATARTSPDYRSLGYASPYPNTAGGVNVSCTVQIRNTGTVDAYGFTVRDTPSTSGLNPSSVAVPNAVTWNPLNVSTSGAPITLSTDWATSSNSYLEWTTDPADPFAPGEVITIDIDFNVDGWAFDRDPAVTYNYLTGSNAVTLGRIGYKPSASVCAITSGATPPFVAPCIGANQTSTANLVFERSQVRIGKGIARSLDTVPDNVNSYSLFANDNRLAPSSNPTVTSGDGDYHKAYAPAYGGYSWWVSQRVALDVPIPAGVAVPNDYPLTWWVADVSVNDLDNMNTMTFTENLPYGLRYMPGTLQGAQYTWDATAGAGSYAFTNVPDAGITTVNPTTNTECPAPVNTSNGGPAGPGLDNVIESNTGDTVTFNFNKGGTGASAMPWGSAATLWDAGTGAPRIGQDSRAYTKVIRFVFATRGEKLAAECPEKVSPEGAFNYSILHRNKITVDATHNDGTVRTNSNSRLIDGVKYLGLVKNPKGGTVGAGGTAEFKVSGQWNANLENNVPGYIVVEDTIADYDPVSGTNLYVPGTSSATISYVRAEPACPGSVEAMQNLPAQDVNLRRDPFTCEVIRDPLTLNETVVSRSTAGTVVRWTFPDTSIVSTQGGVTGHFHGLVPCQWMPETNPDGSPALWSDGTPRGDGITGGDGSGGCARQFDITMPVPIPADAANGMQIDNAVKAYSNFAMIAGNVTNDPSNSTYAYPEVDQDHLWNGIEYATDTGFVQVVSGDPAPTPVKTGPDSVQPGEEFNWTVSVPLASGDNYFDLRTVDTLPDWVDFVGYGSATCADSVGSCSAFRGTAIGRAPAQLSPVANADGTTTIGWWTGDVSAASDPRTLTFVVRVKAKTVHDGTPVVAGDQMTNTVITQSELVDVYNSATQTVLPTVAPEFESAPAVHTVEIVEPNLEIVKSVAAVNGTPYAGQALAAGDVVSYSLLVTNTGGAIAVDFPVVDTPDAAVTNVVATGLNVSALEKGWTAARPDLRWFISSLEPGTTLDLTYDATIDAGYALLGMSTTTNAAVAGPFTGLNPDDPDTRSYPAVDDDLILGLKSPLLAIDKYSNGACDSNDVFVSPGRAQQWCVVVTNAGTDVAKAAQLVDALPADWTYTDTAGPRDPGAVVAATVGGVTAAPTISAGTGGNQVLTWPLGDLAIGESVTVKYFSRPDVDASATGVNRARAQIRLANGDVAPSSAAAYVARDTASARLAQFDLEVAKTPDLQTLPLLPAGGPITWTIAVTNPGSETLHGLSLVDDMPAGLVYTPGSATSTCAGFAELSSVAGPAGTTRITWTVPTMASLESCDITVTGTLPSGTGVATRDYVNIVSATAEEVGTSVENTAKAHAFAPGSIGDTVFHDVDGDGVQDAGELGIAGVTVTVTWAGADGIFGSADDATFTDTTDASGQYLVTGLEEGLYNVSVATADLPAGLTVNTADPDGGFNSVSVYDLAPGEDNRTQDFGYQGNAELGDTIWWDTNGDGTQESGEPGIGGITVELTWAGIDGAFGTGDDVVQTAVTDTDGHYLFTGLADGDYQVVVVNPPAATQTGDPDSTLDSQSTATLSAGDSDLTHDFGYQPDGVIGDTIWFDTDGNGVQDSGESGIAGIDVTLTWFGPDGVAGGGDDVTFTDQTDSSGNYLITNLVPGEYSVTVVNPPAGYVQTGDPDSTMDNASQLTLALGEHNLDQDFGYQELATVGDYVWFDTDGDGVQDSNEPPLEGITINLIDADGEVVATQVTDSNGHYLFTDVVPGTYSIQVIAPNGLVQSGDPDGTMDSMSSVTLSAGENNLAQDFGYRGDASLGDTIWMDFDGDGVQDAGEPGIAGVTVTVTGPGPDGVLGTDDDTSQTTVTDVDGHYLVEGLVAGDHAVVVTPPSGLTQTGDPDANADNTSQTTLALGESDLDQDFGYQPQGSIGDHIWLDIDHDGLQDSTEVGLSGVLVTLTWYGPDGVAGGGDDVTWTTTTDANGDYLFEHLPQGEYDVVVAAPAGTVQSGDPDSTLDNKSHVSLGVGATDLDQDFGYYGTASLGHYVWIDTDGDGVFDPDETGITSVTMNLYDDQGHLIATTQTDSHGYYEFTGLPAGTYTVKVDLDDPDFPEGMTSTFDPDGDGNSEATVTLDAGERDLTSNFGYQPGTAEPEPTTTTVAPTTAVPTTAVPTTGAPATSAAPTSTAPTTAAPEPTVPRALAERTTTTSMASTGAAWVTMLVLIAGALVAAGSMLLVARSRKRTEG